MTEAFFRKVRLVVEDPEIRNRILFTLGALIVFRMLAAIPVPGINPGQLQEFFANNQFLGLLNIFSGGGLSNLSIVLLGVGPYITAAIILQLGSVLSPKLKSMYQEEGEAGRTRFMQYSRYLTVPLAVVQGLSFLLILRQNGVLPAMSSYQLGINTLMVVAGSVLLMWIGELITEFGIGNGVSLIIAVGILARIPSEVSQLAFTFDPSQLPTYLAFAVAVLAVLAAVVFVMEAERPVPVTYSRSVRGMQSRNPISTYIPLRLLYAGVMPIIFALSILLFPQMIATFFQTSSNPTIASIAASVVSGLSSNWIHGVLYFFLVVIFTYFYTAITFEPHQIAKNLQKNGGFIPGVRPGTQTTEYLGNVITRITLFGAVFLGIVAVLPTIVQGITGITTLTIGGTALLIVIAVLIDVIKKVDAQTSIREY